MTENRHEANPNQMMFDFMYRSPYGFYQLEIDFAPSMRPLGLADMLQKRDNIEINAKKVKKSAKKG